MKVLYPISLSLILILFSSGCLAAATPQPSPPTSTTPLPGVTETVQVRLGDSLVMGEDSPERQLLLAQIERFEELHPEIDIVLKPWIWDPSTFADQLAAGEIFDVMEIAATEGSLVIPGGYAADLTELMAGPYPRILTMLFCPRLCMMGITTPCHALFT